MNNKNKNNLNLIKSNLVVNLINSKSILKKDNSYLHHFIASVFYLYDEDLIKIKDLVGKDLLERLNYLSLGTMKIIFVTDQEKSYSKIEDHYTIENKPRFESIVINKDLFFKTFTYDTLEEVIRIPVADEIMSSNTIFIFMDSSWRELVENFRARNIVLSGGSVTQRFILSPVHFKLAQFLIAFYSLKGQSVFVPVNKISEGKKT